MQINILYFCLTFFGKKPEQNIMSAFIENHPNSKYPIWYKIKDGSWQVSFNESHNHAIADFPDDGKWLVTRFLIQFLLLPQNVREAFEAQFKKEFIMEVYTLKFKKVNLYEFFINENNKTKSLIFSTSGMLLNSISFKS